MGWIGGGGASFIFHWYYIMLWGGKSGWLMWGFDDRLCKGGGLPHPVAAGLSPCLGAFFIYIGSEC